MDVVLERCKSQKIGLTGVIYWDQGQVITFFSNLGIMKVQEIQLLQEENF